MTRRVTPRAPRAWRVIPLLAGIAELGLLRRRRASRHHRRPDGRYLPGFLLIMAGLVIAGPVADHGRRAGHGPAGQQPGPLIAGRRLADNPRAAFRAISGLILALFVTAAAVGVITTIVDDQAAPARQHARRRNPRRPGLRLRGPGKAARPPIPSRKPYWHSCARSRASRA